MTSVALDDERVVATPKAPGDAPVSQAAKPSRSTEASDGGAPSSPPIEPGDGGSPSSSATEPRRGGTGAPLALERGACTRHCGWLTGAPDGFEGFPGIPVRAAAFPDLRNLATRRMDAATRPKSHENHPPVRFFRAGAFPEGRGAGRRATSVVVWRSASHYGT